MQKMRDKCVHIRQTFLKNKFGPAICWNSAYNPVCCISDLDAFNLEQDEVT